MAASYNDDDVHADELAGGRCSCGHVDPVGCRFSVIKLSLAQMRGGDFIGGVTEVA